MRLLYHNRKLCANHKAQGILRPFPFDDWNAHEEFYMSILREDAKILERYDAGKGKKA